MKWQLKLSGQSTRAASDRSCAPFRARWRRPWRTPGNGAG